MNDKQKQYREKVKALRELLPLGVLRDDRGRVALYCGTGEDHISILMPREGSNKVYFRDHSDLCLFIRALVARANAMADKTNAVAGAISLKPLAQIRKAE